MKKRVITVLLLVLTVLGLCGCGDRNKLVGTWAQDDNSLSFEFNKDGTGMVLFDFGLLQYTFAYDFTYSLDDDSLEMIIDRAGLKIIENYTISFENESLIMTDSMGKSQTYYRK